MFGTEILLGCIKESRTTSLKNVRFLTCRRRIKFRTLSLFRYKQIWYNEFQLLFLLLHPNKVLLPYSEEFRWSLDHLTTEILLIPVNTDTNETDLAIICKDVLFAYSLSGFNTQSLNHSVYLSDSLFIMMLWLWYKYSSTSSEICSYFIADKQMWSKILLHFLCRYFDIVCNFA